MAWFALSIRSPKALWWDSNSAPQTVPARRSEVQRDIYLPRTEARHAEVLYTVRIFDPSARPNLLGKLRSVVKERGGMEIGELVEGRGFIFSMPPDTQDPLTGYQHGNLLEEGCIQVTRTTMGKESRRRCESVESSDDDEGDDKSDRTMEEEETEDHANLHMQWTWTELKR